MKDPLTESEHRSARTLFRVLGPVLLLVGAACLIVSLVDFFRAAGSFGGPKLFWLGFVGMPLLFAGVVITNAGFMGKITRYYGREVGPAASATFNDVARDSAPGLRAVGEALRGDTASDGGSRCAGCDAANDADAKFCAACGEPMPAAACNACGHPANPGARFCDECGGPLAH